MGLTVGIDARAATEVRAGRGRYVRELLRQLARLEPEPDHSFLLYARSQWACDELDDRFEWSLIGAPDPLWHVLAARRASRVCDVYLSTNSYLTLWFTRVPSVPVVFDMVAFDPRWRPQRRASLIERTTLGRAVRRGAAIIAISESTRRALVDRYPRAGSRAHVIHLGADPSFAPDGRDANEVRERYGLEKPYVLTASTLEPRKNLPRLIEAFVGLPEPLPERHELAIVGGRGWDTGETLASIAANRDKVRALGHVPEADLRAIYREAKVFCYPSLAEGFGLPVLEAMQSGTPVVTSNLSSLPEVGGDAAVYVDPFDVEDIRAALQEILLNEALREDLARRGVERAARFDWGSTARETLALLESVARRRG